MKAKKALKKLNKVEALLSHVMEAFPAGKQGLGNLLGAAKTTIAKAIQTVNSSTDGGKTKPSARTAKARNGRLSEEGRRNISLAAKKRWAAAKRKGVNAVTGQRLSKTA